MGSTTTPMAAIASLRNSFCASGSHRFKNKELEVQSFWDRQQNRVVGSLGSAFEDAQSLAGIERCFGDDLEQHRLTHVMAAGAGYKDPAGFEHPECSDVNVLVAPGGIVNLFSRFSEGRRVQDDGV